MVFHLTMGAIIWNSVVIRQSTNWPWNGCPWHPFCSSVYFLFRMTATALENLPFHSSHIPYTPDLFIPQSLMLDYVNARLNKLTHVGELQVWNLVGPIPYGHRLFNCYLDKITRQSHYTKNANMSYVPQHIWNYWNFEFIS